MRAPDLQSEAERLSRPCTYLVPVGEDLAAVWGGPPAAPSPGPEYRHWISIDARFLPRRERGWVSVFVNQKDFASGAVVFTLGPELPLSRLATPLFARPALSLPPIDAVFRFGSPDVQSWLASQDWGPTLGFNDGFPDRGPVHEYEAVYQAQLPLYCGGAHAVVGGWHFPWPEGDWVDLVECNLLVWTFEDSEPWVEAWTDGTRDWVVQRTT